jgi:predicted  nucleic acid-binding Zn-ribbon protein
MSGVSNWGPVLVIVLGYVLGFYFQNRRIDDLRDAMNQWFEGTNQRFEGINQRFEGINQRFDDMNRRFDDMNQRFADMNQRFNSIDARFSELRDFIKAEISRVEDRIERLEHPVARP